MQRCSNVKVDMARPHFADEGDGLQISKLDAKFVE